MNPRDVFSTRMVDAAQTCSESTGLLGLLVSQPRSSQDLDDVSCGATAKKETKWGTQSAAGLAFGIHGWQGLAYSAVQVMGRRKRA